MANVLKIVLGLSTLACAIIAILFTVTEIGAVGWVFASSFSGATIVSLYFYWLVDVLERIAMSTQKVAEFQKILIDHRASDGGSHIAVSVGSGATQARAAPKSTGDQASLVRQPLANVGKMNISTRPNGTATVSGPSETKHFHNYSDAFDYAKEADNALS